MLQDPQVLRNDHNKPQSLMSDPISTMYFHNMSCDLLNKILFKPIEDYQTLNIPYLFLSRGDNFQYFTNSINSKLIFELFSSD